MSLLLLFIISFRLGSCARSFARLPVPERSRAMPAAGCEAGAHQPSEVMTQRREAAGRAERYEVVPASEDKRYNGVPRWGTTIWGFGK